MLRPVGSPINPVMSPIRKITVWPRSWKCFILRSRTVWPEMQIGRGRIKAGLDAQRPAERQALAQLLFANEFGESLLQIRNLLLDEGANTYFIRSGGLPSGFRREARLAGSSPKTRPTMADTAKAITIDQTDIGISNWSVKN